MQKGKHQVAQYKKHNIEKPKAQQFSRSQEGHTEPFRASAGSAKRFKVTGDTRRGWNEEIAKKMVWVLANRVHQSRRHVLCCILQRWCYGTILPNARGVQISVGVKLWNVQRQKDGGDRVLETLSGLKSDML